MEFYQKMQPSVPKVLARMVPHRIDGQRHMWRVALKVRDRSHGSRNSVTFAPTNREERSEHIDGILLLKANNEKRNDEWFQKCYVPVRLLEYEDVNLDDLDAVFDDCEEQRDNEQCRNEDMSPLILNAFDLIVLSQGLNLASLFDRDQDSTKHQTRFVSQKPAKVVLSSMEVVAQSMGFKTHIRNFKMRVEGLSAKHQSHFSVILEIFEVAPTFLMVDIQKAAGDSVEYLQFYKDFRSKLEDIVWKPPIDSSKSRITKAKSKKR